jgi:hypothetical protein
LQTCLYNKDATVNKALFPSHFSICPGSEEGSVALPSETLEEREKNRGCQAFTSGKCRNPATTRCGYGDTIAISNHDWLVVSNIFYFPFHIWDVILPNGLSYVSRWLKPPTR